MDVLDRAITAVVAVVKMGKKPLVNGSPGANDVDGRREFPRGSQVSAIVGYYDTLLSSNGWTIGTDYLVAGNSIHFYGISNLACGTDNPHLGVYGAVDSGSAGTSPPSRE